jgi:hypothetical protein
MRAVWCQNGMRRHPMTIEGPRPYFAELPYYLWGEANYDSNGNCLFPTDKDWTFLLLENRETRARVLIIQEQNAWCVEGTEPEASRTAHYLATEYGATLLPGNAELELGEWDHESACARTQRVRKKFANSRLAPFDHNAFFGSWKWVGWNGGEFTLVGQFIMESLLVNDTRAVELCASWLRQAPVVAAQSVALRYALEELTGLSFSTDEEWITWYYGRILPGEGKKLYPPPDFENWFEEKNPGLSWD